MSIKEFRTKPLSRHGTAIKDPRRHDEGEKKQELTRIQLEMPKERVDELDELAVLTGARTRKEVINNALSLFELAVEQSQLGRRLAFVDEDEQKYQVFFMPALQAAFSRPSKPRGRPAREQRATTAT